MSGGTTAVDNDVGCLVRQERGGHVFDSVGRKVDRTGQVRVIICNLWQCLDELKLVTAGDLVVQFVSGNCSNHNCSIPSLGKSA